MRNTREFSYHVTLDNIIIDCAFISGVYETAVLVNADRGIYGSQCYIMNTHKTALDAMELCNHLAEMARYFGTDELISYVRREAIEW